MSAAIECVVSQLSASGIVAPGKLERFMPPHAHPNDIGELVDALAKQALLTPFQAQQIKAGKVSDLVLGAYILLDKLGAGGMGQVFKAEHRRMKRVVAVKMLPTGLMKDAAAIARFEREVEAAAKLEHPNIVTAYDADQAGDAHFLVMQFVAGSDLSALVKKNGPLQVNQAVDYMLQAARGLQFAHGKGVVHRDIKPANLLLGNDGVVRILDMGLARIEGDGEASTRAELTNTGAIMGTVDYMAPDQALDIRHADARADIYSLGCSLYYLIAGKPMYEGASLMAKLLAHRERPIPLLSDLPTAVPKQLDAIYQKMVAKQVADRYQSMTEVVAALEGLSLASAQNSRSVEGVPTVTFSEERKTLTATRSKTRLGSISEVVASEKTKHLFAKIMGGAFATIIAPILVAYLIKYLERDDSPPRPNTAASASASRDEHQASSAGDTKESALLTTAGGRSPTIPKPQPSDSSGWQGWPPEAPPPAIAPFPADQAVKHQDAWARYLGVPVVYQNPLGMKFRLIPPGEFTMGTPPEETELLVAKARKSGPWLVDALRSEGSPRRVVVRQPFYLGACEVTNEQFAAFAAATGYQTADERSGLGGESYENGRGTVRRPEKVWRAFSQPDKENYPVAHMLPDDAETFCKWLSQKYGGRYELPKDEEWEYACRAGTTGKHFCPENRLTEYVQDTNDLAAVGQKLPNPFGLYDMLGNQRELASALTGPVLRGGSGALKGTGQLASRCASRDALWKNGDVSALLQGFRVAIVGDLKTLVAPLRGNEPWRSPAFERWVSETQSLPAAGQLDAVARKLKELNPDFDGKLAGYSGIFAHGHERPHWSTDGKDAPTIEDGAVTELGFGTDHVRDISPLRALRQLKRLSCMGSDYGAGVLADLSPLYGLSLNALNCRCNRIVDLSKLVGLPVESLNMGGTRVRDLAPLGKLPLKRLICDAMPVSSLEPLRGLQLRELRCNHTAITDLSPLEGMPLNTLICFNTKVSSLAALSGMPLETLNCGELAISDLSPLTGMPLKRVHFDGTHVADLTPLEHCMTLRSLTLNDSQVTAAAVAALRKALPDCTIVCKNPLP